MPTPSGARAERAGQALPIGALLLESANSGQTKCQQRQHCHVPSRRLGLARLVRRLCLLRPACCSALGSPREAFIQPMWIGTTTKCAPGYSCPWLRAFLSVLIWHPDAVAGVRETPLHVAFAACHATREKGKVRGQSQKDGSLSWAQEFWVSARTTFCFLEAHGGFLRSRPDWGLDYLRWTGGRGCRAATMVSQRDPSETSRERPSTTRAPQYCALIRWFESNESSAPLSCFLSYCRGHWHCF